MWTRRDLRAHLRGGVVGGTSGAVSIAAHAAGGGAAPGQSVVTVLLAAVVAIGALAAATRIPVGVILVIGQIAGHFVLSLDSGHLHVPGVAMLAAHASAVVVASWLIRAADRGYGLVCAAVDRLLPVFYRPAPVRVAPTRPVTRVPRVRRTLLPSAGLGTRGPPVVTF